MAQRVSGDQADKPKACPSVSRAGPVCFLGEMPASLLCATICLPEERLTLRVVTEQATLFQLPPGSTDINDPSVPRLENGENTTTGISSFLYLLPLGGGGPST